MKISVLCTNRNSIYKKLGLDCYDETRNVRTYTGTTPVIAHPPCREYSTFLRHRANAPAGEKDLALFCTERIKLYGGILEHPRHSHYVKHFIGKPSWQVLSVNQKWWGHPTTKSTWLLMPDWYQIPELPFNLVPHQAPENQIANMSKTQRSATPILFAKFLIDTIRLNHANIATPITRTALHREIKCDGRT